MISFPRWEAGGKASRTKESHERTPGGTLTGLFWDGRTALPETGRAPRLLLLAKLWDHISIKSRIRPAVDRLVFYVLTQIEVIAE